MAIYNEEELQKKLGLEPYEEEFASQPENVDIEGVPVYEDSQMALPEQDYQITKGTPLEIPEAYSEMSDEESDDTKEPKKQSLEDMFQEYLSLKGSREQALKEARERDRQINFAQDLNKAFQQIGTGLASGYANVKMQPIDFGKSDEEARLREQQKGRLSDLLSEYKIQKAMTPEKTSELEEAKLAKEKALAAKYGLEAKALEKKEESKKIPETKITKGQEATDRAFAKEYSDFIAGGGYASVEKNLDDLKKVVTRLEKDDDITGTLREKVLPFEWLRSAVNEEAQDLKDTVERVIQQSLRQTLGAQFTEKEAQRLIERSYNPRLSDEKNIERLKATINEIENMAKAKQKASSYFEEKGTLAGYKGDVKLVPEEKENPLVKKYADQYGLDYNKAERILKNRGAI